MKKGFRWFSHWIAELVGSPGAFALGIILVIIWAATGPFFNYSDTWQLIINTGTTVITFLMVFLIQKAQNKDSLAIQLKLNELVASNEYSSNSLVDIESMTEEEMIIVQKYYHRLSELAKKDESVRTSHSIAEAHEQHQRKDQNRTKMRTKNSTKK